MFKKIIFFLLPYFIIILYYGLFIYLFFIEKNHRGCFPYVISIVTYNNYPSSIKMTNEGQLAGSFI